MLRNFYILICIYVCFCYEYSEENHQNQLKTLKEIRKSDKKNKVVQFDVASFIKNSATASSQDYEPFAYRNKKRDNRRTQSEDYYESPINENKGDKESDYFNIENYSKDAIDDSDQNVSKDEGGIIDPNASFEDNLKNEKLVNKVKNDPNELLSDRYLIQNPEKKCAFKDMRVPFFSRKSTTAKKQKKRKLFCFNCSKTYTDKTSKSDASSKAKQPNAKAKGAYGNLCPKCIRKILQSHHKRRSEKSAKNKEIHNSREFYQNVVTTPAQANGLSVKRTNGNANLNDYFFSNNNRVKREENEERERQLKELAEVEKKVDHVKIITPFTKTP